MKIRLPRDSRPLRVLVGLLLFAAARWGSAPGTDWERNLHPDEPTIVGWIGQVREYGYPAEWVYPGGWFQLFRLRMLADNASDAFDARSAQLPEGPALRPAPKRPPPNYKAYDARRFNLSLHAGSTVCTFLAGLEAGFSLPAAAFGAAFLAVQPGPLEFAHYGETDEALVFCLSLTLWLVLRALRRGGAGRFALAMLAAGFAFASKYTLAPLVLYALLLPALLPGRPAGRTRRAAALAWAGLAAVGLTAFLGGFLLGTPALVLNPEFFFSSLPQRAARTYGEMSGTLGPRASLWWAPFVQRLGSLAKECAKPGLLVWGWLLLSAACCVRGRGGGRIWAAGPLFAAVFLVYAVLWMPWIRNQETLAPLVALCLVAGAPADRALRRLREGGPDRRALALAAAVLAAGAAAFAVSAAQGSRMVAAFREPDRRRVCRMWLRTSAPADRVLALDAYCDSVAPQLPCAVDGLSRLPLRYSRKRFDARSPRPDYYLRNVSHVDRTASRTLWSQELLPEPRAHLDAFLADAVPLGSWRMPEGSRIRPVFQQHDVTLYALPRAGAPGSELAPVDLAFDRPLLVESGDVPLWCGDPAAPVGPAWAIRTVGKRNAIRLPEPAAGRRLWGVTRSTDGDATVHVEWDGPMAAAPGDLPPGGAKAAPLRPASFALRAAFDPFPRARVRIRGDESRAACATFLSNDAAEVARALRLGGDPAAALAVVRGEDAPSPAVAAEGLLAALAAGEAPDPAWREAAAAALAAWDGLAARLRAAEADPAADPAAARVRGAPLSALRDFARARFGAEPAFPREPFPLVLPPGTYRMRFVATEADAAWFEGVRLVDGQSGPVAATGPAADGDQAYELVFSFRRAAPLRLSDSLPPAEPGVSPTLRDVEVSWDPVEALERSAAELRAALAAPAAAR